MTQADNLLRLNHGIVHSRLVTLIIPAGSTASKFFFDDQPDLRYARIVGMEAVDNEMLRQAVPSNVPVFPAAFYRSVAVSLETNNPDKWDEDYPLGRSANDTGQFWDTGLYIRDQPMVTFLRTSDFNSSFMYQLFEFNNLFISWSKSFITLLSPKQAEYAVCFMVYYTYRSINGKLIQKRY